eukprot:CAMPEP_0119488898 /NCGR_PEP_ID=MMETSP1344-20130328/14522_1 /TAXON_ID=236787 /ORGANISM="Florenciella parvula, Strain CCMP2471" /LENGTH=66 /DNA_ID=CAMNT_0007523891 /DNA_START=99 /DNA_END=299 /DNA_ORIENTATION=+
MKSAFEWPCSTAAFKYHGNALLSSRGTPRPVLYMLPKFIIASGVSCSAAFWYQRTASVSFFSTPVP